MCFPTSISKPLESDSDVIETSSVVSRSSICDRKISFLCTTPRRGTDIQMDMIMVVANELLQNCKKALESEGKIKKEAKATYTACRFYVNNNNSAVTLRLLKQAQVQSGGGAILQSLVAEMHLVRKEVSDSLKEIPIVRSWLGHETRETFRNIKECLRANARSNNNKASSLQDADAK
ncbi:unnamed protein product [Euphydryas editha]|uniref:Uncharacterized protein n=1 Tax=Euphydryas editha TaxID=104508 RepID=A0AAU9TTR5_EUPED|nr:unnamed protein product [Euphydryas editha]